jgi:hypothetical protein
MCEFEHENVLLRENGFESLKHVGVVGSTTDAIGGTSKGLCL